MVGRVSSPEGAGCFCFNLDSGLTRALPKERNKRALCPLFLRNRYPTHRESRNLKYFNNGNLESNCKERRKCQRA